MKSKTALRVILVILWAFFLVLYAASKIDFFSRYNANGTGQHLRHHSIYWVAIAATTFLIWLVEMFGVRPNRARTEGGRDETRH